MGKNNKGVKKRIERIQASYERKDEVFTERINQLKDTNVNLRLLCKDKNERISYLEKVLNSHKIAFTNNMEVS